MFYKSKSQFRVNLGLMLEYSLLSPPFLSLSYAEFVKDNFILVWGFFSLPPTGF